MPAEYTSTPHDFTYSDVYEALRNQRRRYLLYYLQHSDPPEARLGTVADQIAAWEHDRAPDEINAAQRKRVYTSLSQSHLPKLDELGFIEWDSQNRITATPIVDDLSLYTQFTDIPSDSSTTLVPWCLGISIGMLGVATAHIAQVPFIGQSTLALAFVASSMLLFLVTVHHIRSPDSTDTAPSSLEAPPETPD